MQRTKKILKIKIFAKKAKKLRKNKNDNSNCFYAQIKGFYHKFQFSVVDRRSKTLFGIYFSISIVDLCNNFFNKISCLKKKIEIFFHFMILLAIFLQNKCKIGDLLAIFFFAFFASFSLQRIFFAKIFFFAKNSLLVPSIVCRYI